jgi:lipoic acid synthetase
VVATLRDLRDHGVDIVNLGQYLRPSKRHLPVRRWVTPEEFDALAESARDLGFLHVEAGPLVRSSYRADMQAEQMGLHHSWQL